MEKEKKREKKREKDREVKDNKEIKLRQIKKR